MTAPRTSARPTTLRRLVALTVVAGLGVAGCSSGGDDDTADDPTTTVAAESDTGASDGAGPVDGGEVAADGIDEDLGAVPSLKGLTRDELLQEGFGVPAEMPVLDLEMLYVFSSAAGLTSGFGTAEAGVDYTAPDGDADEVLATVDAAIDPEAWEADGEVTEPNDGYYSQRYRATAADGGSLTVTFQEDQGKVVLRSSAQVESASPPELLWPWAGDIQAPEGAAVAAWGVQYPDTALGPNLAFTQTYSSDLGYDALAAFVSALPAGVLVPGEVTTESDPFTETEVAVTTADGFAGRFSITQTNPESDPNVNVAGTVPVG